MEFLKFASQMIQLDIDKSEWHMLAKNQFIAEQVEYMADSCCDSIVEAISDHEHLISIKFDQRRLYLSTCGVQLMTLSR